MVLSDNVIGWLSIIFAVGLLALLVDGVLDALIFIVGLGVLVLGLVMHRPLVDTLPFMGDTRE